MDAYLFVYFFVGVLQDFLVTMNWKYVAKNKILPAVSFSFLTTLVNMVSLYDILTRLDQQNSLFAIVVYATGISMGTLLAMVIDKPKKSKKTAAKTAEPCLETP